MERSASVFGRSELISVVSHVSAPVSPGTQESGSTYLLGGNCFCRLRALATGSYVLRDTAESLTNDDCSSSCIPCVESVVAYRRHCRLHATGNGL